MKEFYKRFRGCVLQIICDKNYRTGFFVEKGKILTCLHKLNKEKDIIGVWKGKEYKLTLIKQDERDDIALLKIDVHDHPFLQLKKDRNIGDELLIHGCHKPNSNVYMEDLVAEYDGEATLTKDSDSHISFKGPNITYGFSGAPILNTRTKKVCGIVKRTKDANSPSGGRGISAETIFKHLPELEKLGSPSIDETRLLYSSGIQNFWHEYLGTDEHPVPFGGRADMLSKLDDWWQDEQAPAYGLLTAEAGRGKSALLVRWAKQMMEQQRAAVLFVPISIRFQTNSSMAVFSTLAAYLAQLHGEEFSQFSFNSSPEPYQQYCFRLLKKPLADGWPLLIILDGLDEAMGWQVGPHLFPVPLPPQTKLLVSARLEEGWQDRLGWSGHSRVFCLPFLKENGVGDVLQQMGNPLDAIANQLDVVPTLYRLSEGDPLLVRLYVDLLSEQINQTGQTSELVAWLQKAHPGLDGYFDRWWDDQRTLWGKDSPLKEKTTQCFMNLLAAALGPLSPVDLNALYPTLSNWDIEEILPALARFIIRQEKSFTFSHPKLRLYFYDKLFLAKQRDLKQRFLNYGATSLQQMQTETETDYRQYRYVIRHYMAHLQQANAPYDDFTAVLCHAWARAWHALEGTYAGFLADVEQIRKKATDRADVGTVIWCDLCHSSVITLSNNVPPSLLSAAVKLEIYTPQQALVIIGQMHDPAKQSQALIQLIPFLPPDLSDKVISLISKIQDELLRVETLIVFINRLEIPLSVLHEIFEIARNFQDTEYRINALKTVVKLDLPPTLLLKVFETIKDIEEDSYKAYALEIIDLLPNYIPQAFEIIQNIQDERYLADALKTIIPHLPPTLLDQTFEAIKSIEDEEYRVEALINIIPHLSPDFLLQAFEIIEHIKAENYQIKALMSFLKRAPENLLRKALHIIQDREDQLEWTKVSISIDANLLPDHLTKVFQDIQNEKDRVYVLKGIIPDLPVILLDEAIKISKGIKYKPHQIDTLMLIVERLSNQQEVVDYVFALIKQIQEEGDQAQAVEVVRNIHNERYQVEALKTIIPDLTPTLLAQIFKTIQNIQDERYRAEALKAIMLNLIDDLSQAFEIVKTFQDKSYQAEALKAMMLNLTLNDLSQTFEIIQNIQDEQYQVAALKAIIPHLPPMLLDKATKISKTIKYRQDQIDTLMLIVDHSSDQEEIMNYARELTKYIEDKQYQLETLRFLFPCLQSHEQQQYIDYALKAVENIQNEKYQVDILTAISPLLQSHQQQQYVDYALKVVENIQNEKYQVDILTAISPLLQSHQQQQHIDYALKVVENIQNEKYQIRALITILPILPPDQQRKVLARALQVAQNIKDRALQTEALTKLISYLPTDQKNEILDQVLQVAQDIENEWSQANALTTIALYLPTDQQNEILAQALQVAQNIEDASDQINILVTIVPHLPTDQRNQILARALQIAQNIDIDRLQINAFTAIAPHLSTEQQKEILSQAFQLTQNIQDDIHRVQMLDKLAPQLAKWAETDPTAVFPLWQQAYKPFLGRPRPDFLRALQALMPLTLATVPADQRPSLAQQIAQAIFDVTRWWP